MTAATARGSSGLHIVRRHILPGRWPTRLVVGSHAVAQRVLAEAVQQHQPPITKGIRPKLRYAHQGGSNPPLIVVHGGHVEGIKQSYARYLEGVFRKAFELSGTPLRVQFKQGENPYAETEKRKAGEGLVSMRRRKNALRAELKARKLPPAGKKR